MPLIETATNFIVVNFLFSQIFSKDLAIMVHHLVLLEDLQVMWLLSNWQSLLIEFTITRIK